MKIAALRAYGLLESVGEGVQISQLAMRLLHQAEGTPDYTIALTEAALRPELFRKLVETHLHASAETVASHLILKLQFTEDGAKAAARSFRETIALAKLDDSSYNPEVEENENEAKAKREPERPANPLQPPAMTGTSTTQPSGTLPIPVGDGQVAWVPFPIDEDAFELLMGTLRLWKKKLVRQQEPVVRQPEPLRQAIWHNKDHDKRVVIAGEMGEKNGETYWRTLDGTGIPESQLEFVEPDTATDV